MSDGAISQDEIDALLSGVPIDGLNASGQVAGSPTALIDTAVLDKFVEQLRDPLVENLKKMTGAECSAEKPSVQTTTRDQLLATLPEMVVAVMADFNNALKGDHIYLVPTEFVQKLVSLINKEDNADIDEMALSVLAEALSTHTNDEITALDKTGKLPGLACNPAESVNVPKALVRIPQNTFGLFTYPIKLDGQAYTIWEAISGNVAADIGKALGGGAAPQDSSIGTLSPADMASITGGATQASPMMNMGGGMNMGGMNMGMMGQPQGMQSNMMGLGAPNVQALQYPNLQGGMGGGEQGNISLIMDVFMEMTVELGRTKKQIKDILGMGEGTIIELDKLAGEPVDILVNHKPIAKGEVVVIDENFGVRVTEILSPLERVENLN